MAVGSLEMHALFLLGEVRAKLVKVCQPRFVYVVEQSAEGLYMAELDTDTALVVDDKPGLKLKVGDHFSAAVLASREGGKFEIRFREIKYTIYEQGEFAYVSTAEGEGVVFKGAGSVLLVFGAHAQLLGGLSKPLKAAVAKAAKWRKGELTFKASE